MSPTQSQRHVSVHTCLPQDELLFHSMTGSEQLGRMYSYQLRLLSLNGAIAVADLLGQPMALRLVRDGYEDRFFQGVVTRFGSTGSTGAGSEQLYSYEASVHPALWLLQRSADCRIFEQKSVPEIVKQVCLAGRYVAMGFQLSLESLGGDYPPLEYCVQYRESDFDFVCRLLEEAGIYFYFKHKADGHTMVLADSSKAHQPAPGYESVEFDGGPDARNGNDERVRSWCEAGEIQSARQTLSDYDYLQSAASVNGALLVKAQAESGYFDGDFEQFDYPGRYSSGADGNSLARARLERLHGQEQQISAELSASGLYPGAVFKLRDHPRADQNGSYLVTSASYRIAGGAYASGAGAQSDCSFSSTITAVGAARAYRPPASLARPRMHGPQTAMVVGENGAEIWTDKYGRIKVRFHWDHSDDECASCWLRVAQGWAGKGWGALFLPRVGMEVVVSFLDGDPDRPLVTGCVYHSDALPPYELPAGQTRSAIRSNSSSGGGGYNEIGFDDKKGAEQLYLRAERDCLREVGNDDVLKVGFDKADPGDQRIEICHDQTLSVGGDQGVKVDGDQKIEVGKTIVIEAATSIELKVGSSSIKIEAGKISIVSTEIAIEAKAAMALKAGANLSIEGALVKIN